MLHPADRRQQLSDRGAEKQYMDYAALDAQEVMSRFNRLMHEVMRGRASRNTFAPWEVELLLDMERCGLEPRHARYVLRRYQKTAERQLDCGVTPPLKLSEYLKRHPPGRG